MTIPTATRYFFLFLIVLTASLSLLPGSNGDLPFYIAASIAGKGTSDEQALSETRSLVLSELSGPKSELHLNHIDHADPHVLDYYRIKPLYVWIVGKLHDAGFGYLRSTLIPSLLSFFGIGLLVFSWALKILKPRLALIFSILLLLMNPSIVLARLSSPDALSNLFILLCLWRVYFCKYGYTTLFLLLFSLFIRLDNIIPVLVLGTAMRFWPVKKNRISPSAYILFIALAVLLSAGINYMFEPDFWWFRRATYLASLPAYGNQVMIYFLSLSQTLFPALVFTAALAFFRFRDRITPSRGFVLGAIGTILLLRFLFFPSVEERFMTAYYLGGFLVLLEIFFETGRSGKPGQLLAI